MSKASGSIDLKSLKVAGQTATNFFSVDSSGIMIYDGSNGTQTPSNPDADTNNVFIDPDSLDIRKGTNVLATFSAEETRVGGHENSSISLNTEGIAAIKSDGTEYFQVGLENASVRQDASVSEYFPEGDSQTAHLDANPYAMLYGNINTGDVFDVKIVIRFRYYRTSYPYGYVNTSTSMYWSGVVQSLYRKKGTTNSWTDPDRNTSSAKKVASIYYNATNNTFYASVSKWYFSQHYDTTNHPCSILGVTLELRGNIATPAPSYSFGINTNTSKALGFAIGEGTVPSVSGFAGGKYNKADDANNYAFILGNGVSDSSRSDAFTVDWNGNVDAQGSITAGGTIDVANGAFTVDSSGNIVTSGTITTLNHSSAIGIVVSKLGGTDYTTDISSGTETWKAIGYIEVTVGRYIIFARARFNPTSSGAHYSDINVSTTSANSSNRDRRYGAGTYVNQHSHSTWINVTTDDVDENGLCKIYLNGYSNVAGNWVRTNVAAFYLAAMRIM